MNKVPKEIVEEYILAWLNERELDQLRLVDRHLNKCVQNSHIWQKLHEWRKINADVVKSRFEWHAQHHSGLERCPDFSQVSTEEKMKYAKQHGWWGLYDIYAQEWLIEVSPLFNALIAMNGSALLQYSDE